MSASTIETEWVIAPKNANDRIRAAMKDASDAWFVTGAGLPTDNFPYSAQYQAAIKAAPQDHNLVMVDKDELEIVLCGAQVDWGVEIDQSNTPEIKEQNRQHLRNLYQAISDIRIAVRQQEGKPHD